MKVSAENMSAEETKNYVPPYFEKSAEHRSELTALIRTSSDSKMQLLFGLVSDHTLEKVGYSLKATLE